MGFIFSKQKKNIRVLLLGIEKSGKTTLLYQLKLGQTIAQLSTVGFNLETIKYHKNTFTIWDVGGKQIIRPLWKHYFENTDAVVYVIDGTSDEQRLNETAEELRKVLRDLDLKGVPFLILTNKQDLENAISANELKQALRLGVMVERDWEIMEVSATTGKGLYECLDWIAEHAAST